MYEASKVQPSLFSIYGTTNLLEKNPVCDQKESRLSMFAEKADGFHRSSSNDSGALMSICHFRVVS